MSFPCHICRTAVRYVKDGDEWVAVAKWMEGKSESVSARLRERQEVMDGPFSIERQFVRIVVMREIRQAERDLR